MSRELGLLLGYNLPYGLTRGQGAGATASQPHTDCPPALQTDLLKCVVSADPGRRSHWLVAAFCSFGRFLKAAFFLLLPER